VIKGSTGFHKAYLSFKPKILDILRQYNFSKGTGKIALLLAQLPSILKTFQHFFDKILIIEING